MAMFISPAEVAALAHELLSAIQSAAGGAGIPASVQSHISSASVSAPVEVGPGSYSVSISFGGDMSRPSLEPRKYGGVSNIVALFNKGYSAPKAKYVGGYWHGSFTWGKPSRPALQFIQAACDSFMASHGGEYDIQIEISGEY